LGFPHEANLDDIAYMDSSSWFHHGTAILGMTILPLTAPPIAVTEFLFGFGGRSSGFRIVVFGLSFGFVLVSLCGFAPDISILAQFFAS
jgi:hypothetical protein